MKNIFKTTNIQRLEALPKKLASLKEDYIKHGDYNAFIKDIQKVAKNYQNLIYSYDLFIKFSEELFEKGDKKCAFAFLIAIEDYANKNTDGIADTVTLYLRLAELYLENGQTEKGTNYLVKICTETTDNYEESIKFRNLTDIWDKYKHLVAGKVPESVKFNNETVPVAPENCTMKIGEIFSLPQDELLTAISEHLNEMSGSGESLNHLNKWERIVYDADLVCTEVNSGGFSHYLYYNGNRFLNALRAFETINSNKMIDLMVSVQSKFPSNKMPKSLESIQNKIDKMEEKGIEFENENNLFYNDAQNELLDKLYEFIMNNQKRFR